VVFGIETLARLSHEHTGFASAKIGLGALSAPRANMIALKSHTTTDNGPRTPRTSDIVNIGAYYWFVVTLPTGFLPLTMQS
jgi:hypothetical protein